MAKFNVTQKLKRAKIQERKRAAHGDPATKKLKIKRQPTALSGKQERKLLRKLRRETRDALEKGLITERDVEMLDSEGTSQDNGNNSQATSKKAPMRFYVKKGGKFRMKKLRRKGKSTIKQTEHAPTAPVDAMVE